MIRTPSRFRVRTAAVLFALLALSCAALAWPTEAVLNIAGGVLIAVQVTERGVAELRDLRQLKRFHSSGVSDDLVPWLCQNTKLWTLDLFGSPLTDKGFAELQSLPELQYLHVNGTRITDNSLELALRSFSGLNMLSVNNTQTTEAGRDRFYAKRKFPSGGF